jgi:hypothetical protein
MKPLSRNKEKTKAIKSIRVKTFSIVDKIAEG